MEYLTDPEIKNATYDPLTVITYENSTILNRTYSLIVMLLNVIQYETFRQEFRQGLSHKDCKQVAYDVSLKKTIHASRLPSLENILQFEDF